MATLSKPGYVTRFDLEQHAACPSQVALFAATFGDEAKLNKRDLAKALKVGLDVLWCERFVAVFARAEYERVRASAWVEYERVGAPARAEYERVVAPARAEYECVRASAWVEYERVVAPARAEYERVVAPAWVEYKRVVASALLAALTHRENQL